MPLHSALEAVRDDLDALGHDWALVGALAVAARAEARATLDIDVVVAVGSPEDGDAIVNVLRQKGYRWKASFGRAMASVEVAGAHDFPIRLDLLFFLSGIEKEVARDAERIRVLENLEMPVAVLGDLIALKLLASREPEREHDLRDLRTLVAAATSTDLVRARASVALLVARDQALPGVLEADLERLERGRDV